jgi:hypothetical protein
MGKQIMSHVAPPPDGLVLLGAGQDGRLTKGGRIVRPDAIKFSSQNRTKLHGQSGQP